ncbi:ABC transporter permease [Alkalibacillus haloalkaliphilus]|uniref:ABC transporter permease n=1 Tax=Alkalibacillus haloalkaliphilus TaxID=94136 RepID=UPI00035E3BFC|nr:ABC transporter permease [Alkalibacillus haloalkaliphilus]
MMPVFLAQLAKDRRNPALIILFIVGSVLATVLFTGGTQAPVTVEIFSEEEQAEEVEAKWEELLNQEGDMEFVVTDVDEARDNVRQGRSDLAIKLFEDDYEMVTSSNLPTIQYVDQHVRTVFEREARIQVATEEVSDPEEMRQEINSQLEDPLFAMEVESTTGEELSAHDMGIQLMYAFTLLVAMFIIGFRVNNVSKDKVDRIWDRVILSPVGKTSMYSGYIAYAFFIGFVQTVIVLMVFNYVLQYDLGERFDLLVIVVAVFTFSMVSIAILFTGIVKGPEQFYALYPSVIPLIPLISGAYMMPGTITHPVMTFIGDLFPVSHAIEAMIGITLYDATWQDITQPIIIMILIGVVSMGIGINLVERRRG